MCKWLDNNWFSVISIIATVVGGILALMQWQKSIKLRRSEFINQIIEKLRFDKTMVKAMYLVDYNQVWYNEDFHGGSDNEYIVDRLLSYLSYICYLLNTRNITAKESSILEYELRRACESWSVQAYLFNIYHFSKKRNSSCTFQYLIDFGLKHKIINEEEFKYKDSTKYPHYLNF